MPTALAKARGSESCVPFDRHQDLSDVPMPGQSQVVIARGMTLPHTCTHAHLRQH